MKSIENTSAAIHAPVCQGSECAGAGHPASEWFGDLGVSDDVEPLGVDLYGDRG